MKTKAKEKRHDQIAEAAYAVLAEKGYLGLSMLAVAKRAKASNETLYRWYGDKAGLFQSLIEHNAQQVSDYLEQVLDAADGANEALGALAPKLLELLLSDRAIALNRAAAADASGTLGKVLALSGRDSVLPRVQTLMERQTEIDIAPLTGAEAAALLVELLVGDQQIRRAIGVLPQPTQAQIDQRATLALDRFRLLCSGA
ncbi:TetR/AcrR family transcriptional regulator [Pseudoprimorskyibacter insulae]|uniref:Nucleoid occlusion factor SlmA n=1 Tax=Pseudoprimorskyibacter insulae TaxID=1695997 RepID=A0A2R8AX60_9RHOB|nr:TetR/AcrR family transcriptional regulator [Pseudoprimorskyibacter insulae]SPF80612.1 Nucleoid occlusion factor SlmA [Pseudoprimorskyibacter insulae]